jgi:hypothetical protein
MVSYTIDLLRHDGSIQETRIALFEHDDAAIDHIGGIDHPHAIDVWQGERHVALFPAWPWRTPFQAGSVSELSPRLSASGRLTDSDQVFNETGERWVDGPRATSRLSKLANSAAAANLSWNLENRRSIPRGFCSRDA